MIIAFIKAEIAANWVVCLKFSFKSHRVENRRAISDCLSETCCPSAQMGPRQALEMGRICGVD